MMSTLTSRDRVLTALRHGIPDRVPYMELIVDEVFGLRLLGRPPAAEPPAMSGSLPVTCAFFGGQAYDPVDLAHGLDLDGFCMSIQPRIYFRTTVSEGMHYVVGGRFHPVVEQFDPRLLPRGEGAAGNGTCLPAVRRISYWNSLRVMP